jgi:diguanylate cyclase
VGRPDQDYLRRSTFRRATVAAAAVLAVVLALSDTGMLDDAQSQLIDDVGQLGAGIFATCCCGFTWRRAVTARQARPEWLWRALLFFGVAGWSCGQGAWSWYQVVLNQDLPSPSLADVGYFALPVFAFPALFALPAGPSPRAAPGALGGQAHREPGVRVLLALDALVIVGSLFLFTWSTTLGAVAQAGAPTVGAFLIAVGYPVTDLILVVLVLLLGMFRRPQRPQALLLLGIGLVALSVSDSFFLYLVSVGATRMPPLFNVGFLVGPVLIGLAALAPQPTSRPDPSDSDARAATWYTVLPYLPLGLFGLLVVAQHMTGRPVDQTEAYGLVLLVSVVVLRQLLTTLENLELLRRVRDGQDRLHHQAFHDWLTGLPNRALFRDRLEHAVERHRRDRRQLAVLFCDLDDFKQVNDTLGHAAGDEMLCLMAERLRRCVRSGDTVARLGGDEFAVILDDDQTLPAVVGERMLAMLGEPVTLAGHSVMPRASAGLVVVQSGEPTVTADLLLNRADAAMYAAKRGGKGRLIVYPGGFEHAPPAPDLSALLAEALTAALTAATTGFRPPWDAEEPVGPPPRTATGHHDQVPALRVMYQPIVRLADSTMAAVEALTRWEHPATGSVPPQTLVHVAESAGLINALDDLVLELACRQVALARAGRHPHLVMHVNLTATRVIDPALVDLVRSTLIRHRLPGSALVLEITETGRITDFDAAADVLGQVRRLGVKLALDDFGVGYANLNHLLRLPVDILKLDRTLTEVGADAARSEAITAGAVRIGRDLGIPMIAEGLEDPAQAEWLSTLGCEYGQGFLFCQPVSSPDMGRLQGTLNGS